MLQRVEGKLYSVESGFREADLEPIQLESVPRVFGCQNMIIQISEVGCQWWGWCVIPEKTMVWLNSEQDWREVVWANLSCMGVARAQCKNGEFASF